MAPVTLMSTGVRTIPAYTGPGDVISGALNWWGLRAYSAAKIGTNAVRIRFNDAFEKDYTTLGTGALDVATIATDQGTHGSPMTVVKLYDQTGNGIDVSQAVAANQPQLSLAVLGAFPAVVAITANSTHLDASVAGPSQSTPFMVSAVCLVIYPGGQETLMSHGAAATVAVGSNTLGTNDLWMYAGAATQSVSATDGVAHAMQAAFTGITNGAEFYVDGSNTTGLNPGSSVLNGADIYSLFSLNTTGQYWNGDFFELGVWSSTWSLGQRSSMNSNQHTYWGF